MVKRAWWWLQDLWDHHDTRTVLMLWLIFVGLALITMSR